MTRQDSPRQGGGRRMMAAALAVIAMIGGALLVYAVTMQAGAPPQPAAQSRSASPADEGDRAGVRSPSPPDAKATEFADGSVPGEPTAAPVAALPGSVPTAISIPAIGVDEEVFPIGLGPDGGLLAPSGDRADLAAWFEGSPTPGELGPSVIEGHVTWRGKPSVFFDLGALEAGDRIEVAREDGRPATFEVYDAVRYPKEEFPTLAVYGRTAGPELRVITCGGDLDSDGHHLDNTVIFARLVTT